MKPPAPRLAAHAPGMNGMLGEHGAQIDHVNITGLRHCARD